MLTLSDIEKGQLYSIITLLELTKTLSFPVTWSCRPVHIVERSKVNLLRLFEGARVNIVYSITVSCISLCDPMFGIYSRQGYDDDKHLGIQDFTAFDPTVRKFACPGPGL